MRANLRDVDPVTAGGRRGAGEQRWEYGGAGPSMSPAGAARSLRKCVRRHGELASEPPIGAPGCRGESPEPTTSFATRAYDGHLGAGPGSRSSRGTGPGRTRVGEGTTMASIADANGPAMGRPMIRLPVRQLYQLSIYWFGINAIWGGLNIVAPAERRAAARGTRRGRQVLALIDVVCRGRRRRGPAHRGLHQRLHDQPLGPAKTVHRDPGAVPLDVGVPCRHRDVLRSYLAIFAFGQSSSGSLQRRAGSFQGLPAGSRPGVPGGLCQARWNQG